MLFHLHVPTTDNIAHPLILFLKIKDILLYNHNGNVKKSGN